MFFMKNQLILGIDVGASGIKGAVVDVATGNFTSERIRVDMPQPSTPEAVAEAFNTIVEQLKYEGSIIGVGFPSVIQKGVALTAANLDSSWIGCNAEKILSERTGKNVVVANDADVAGVAEMRFGRGKGVKGTVVLITIGTGLGSAVFTDGHLLRNTEMGHLLLKNGMVAEKYAADSIKKKEDLSWRKWGKRLNEYLERIEFYLRPNLILLGGGSSKYFEEYKDRIKIEAEVQPAQLLNNAGIVGAAIYAFEQQ
jgi:polyphosphate glucokinase